MTRVQRPTNGDKDVRRESHSVQVNVGRNVVLRPLYAVNRRENAAGVTNGDKFCFSIGHTADLGHCEVRRATMPHFERAASSRTHPNQEQPYRKTRYKSGGVVHIPLM